MKGSFLSFMPGCYGSLALIAGDALDFYGAQRPVILIEALALYQTDVPVGSVVVYGKGDALTASVQT